MTLLRRSLVIVLAFFSFQTLVFGQCENDTTPPVITVPDDITIDCDEDWPPIPPVFCWDDCDEALIPTFTFWYVDNKCGFQSQILLWSATDQAGNSTSETMIVEKCDLSAPVFDMCPEGLTLNCEDPIPGPAEMSATDNCSDFTIDYVETEQELGCPQEKLITRTWTATDIYGNASECIQKISIVDVEAPVIVEYVSGNDTFLLLNDITVDCDEVPGPYTAVATDNCDNDVEIIFTEKQLPGPCEDSYTLYRSYLAVDDCGNVSALDEHNITVVDDEAPVINSNPADITVDCDNIPPANPTLEAQNLLSNASFESPGVHDVPYGGIPGPPHTGDWFAFGAAFSFDQNTSGLATANDGDFFVKIFGAGSGMFQDVAVSPGDNLEASVYLQNAIFDPMLPGCFGLLKLEYFDENNNFISFTETPPLDFLSLSPGVWTELTLNDVAPAGTEYARFVLFMFCPAGGAVMFDDASLTIDVGEPFTDNCDSTPEIEFVEVAGPWVNCQYELARTWTVTDNCGNSSSYTQTITVEDNFAPVLSDEPASTVVLAFACTSGPGDAPVITATDVCDGDVPVTFTESVEVLCPGHEIYTRTWSASDECGNTTTHVQTIELKDDEGPTINHSLDLNITVECDAVPDAESLTATDECSNATVTVSDVVFDGPCEDTYTINRIYIAFDECGNTSSVTQVINVQDTTAPTFDSLPQNASIDCPEQGGGEPDEITASDNCDEEVDVWYTDSFGSCSITRTWYAQDNCGNSTTASQVLSFDDTTAPVLNNVPGDVTVECDNVPGSGEVSASDDCSAAFVTVDDKILPGSCPGNYTILRTYIAIDACGNTATATRTITVEDTTPPTLPDAPADATVSCDDIPPANTNFSNDNVLNNASFEGYQFHDQQILPLPGEFPWTDDWFGFVFAGGDNRALLFPAGNAQDGDFFVKIFGGGAGIFQDQPVNPGDVLNASIYAQNASFDIMPPGCVGRIEISYRDAGGNQIGLVSSVNIDHTSTVDQWVELTINDVAPPGTAYARFVAVVLCPGGGAVMFDNASLLVNPTDPITDNCDPDPSLSFDEETFSDGGCTTSIIRTWTATDACGNSDSVSQVLTVVDNDPPSLSVGADATVECNDPLPPPSSSAFDNCSTPSVSVTPEIIPGECPHEFTMVRTYVATDACGNQTTATQTLTVVDTTPPSFSGVPADEVLFCDPDVPPVVSPTATDNCDPNVTMTFAQDFEFNYNFGNGVIGDRITRTWTATDNCGNSSTATQIIGLVEDCPGNGCVDVLNLHNKPAAMSVDVDFLPNKVAFYWDVPANAVKAMARLISANGTTYHLIHNLNFPKKVNKGFFIQGIEYTVQIKYFSQYNPCKIGSKWSDGTTFIVGGSSAMVEPNDGNPFEDEITQKSLTDSNDYHLDIYPNPNNGAFYLETSLTDYNIEIFDLSGRIVSAKGTFNLNQSYVELESMTPGVYVVRLFNESASLTKRVMIE